MMTPRSSSSGVVAAHVHRRQAADVEGGHRVQIDDGAEGIEVVRAVIAVRAAAQGRAASGGRHRDVQATEVRDRLLQNGFGRAEVGHLDRVEPFAAGVSLVEDGDVGTARGERLGGRPAQTRCAADDHGLLPSDVHDINSRAPATQGRSRSAALTPASASVRMGTSRPTTTSGGTAARISRSGSSPSPGAIRSYIASSM